MKKLLSILAIVILMASLYLTTCSSETCKGDLRDKNLESTLKTRLDSFSGSEYVGMSDVRTLNDTTFQAIIIYYVADSASNRTEHNVRVTTNEDCSEVYTWEDLDSKMLENVKQKVSAKLEENGIDLDGSLIDTLIKLKRR